MKDKVKTINTPVSFEHIREVVDEFVKTLMNDGYLHITSEIVVKEFRDYYTPNIPYKLYESKSDENIYIKNNIFSIEYSDDPVRFLSVYIKIPGHEGDIKEIISFREFIYVYCNPEGLFVLEKIGFIINNMNFEQEEERRMQVLGIPANLSGMDLDDDIPF